MTRPSYAFHTMGCKLNFYDSEVIGSALRDHGFEPAEQIKQADLIIINTCTVTNASDAESRHLIRKYRRQNSAAFIVVTGCYAQASGEVVAAMEEVDLVTNNVDKYQVEPIVRAFHGASSERIESHDIMEKRPAEFRILERFESKTRAFMKVQDGCNLRCAYCIIPFVRGNNRSVPIEDIVRQAQVLADQGVEEIVLTGIHIGTWGRDFRPRKHLTDLLQALEHQGPDIWIRISSLDSPEIPDAMIDLMATSRRILPHLHVPLQAGTDKTLRRMRRTYDTAQYRDRVCAVKDRLPQLCLGADVIVGFPGESDSDFEQTERFLESIPMDYLHVFPYSNRKGTAAAGYKDQINGRVIKNRARRLRDFSDTRRSAHAQRFHGQVRRAIVLPKPLHGMPASVLTDNYIELGIDTNPASMGKRIDVQLSVDADHAVAVPASIAHTVS